MTKIRWIAIACMVLAVVVVLGSASDAQTDDVRLFQMIMQRDLAGATELVAAGSDVNATLGAGETPMMAAASVGAVDIMDLLLQSGSDLVAVDRLGMTALFHAAIAGQDVAAKFILDREPDPSFVNRQNAFGDTALRSAIPSGNVELVGMLLSAGADPNIVNSNGTTAFDDCRGVDDNPACSALAR